EYVVRASRDRAADRGRHSAGGSVRPRQDEYVAMAPAGAVWLVARAPGLSIQQSAVGGVADVRDDAAAVRIRPSPRGASCCPARSLSVSDVRFVRGAGAL